MDSSPIKSLSFDLDGTLLDRNKRIGPRTYRALQAWLDSGGKLFLATSRPLRAVRRYVPADLLNRCSLITMNGAVSQLPGESPRIHSSIGVAAFGIVGHSWFSKHARLSIEIEGLAFGTNVNHTDQELWQIQSATRDMLIPLGEIESARVAKVAINGLGADLREYLGWLEGLGIQAIPEAGHSFINVVAKGIDKASALKSLLGEMGLSSGELMAFGDDLPDLGMLGLAGVRVAMENAADEVKRAADHIIGDCDQDPIGPFLRTFFARLPA
jgi:HAD superfamily hydrolase (TIGR01484 family)